MHLESVGVLIRASRMLPGIMPHHDPNPTLESSPLAHGHRQQPRNQRNTNGGGCGGGGVSASASPFSAPTLESLYIDKGKKKRRDVSMFVCLFG